MIPLLFFLDAGASGRLVQLSWQEQILSVPGMIYVLPVFVLPFFLSGQGFITLLPFYRSG